MVLGKLLDPAVPNPVDARVTDVRDVPTTTAVERLLTALLPFLVVVAACSRGGGGRGTPAARATEMPVALNGESPFQYPADLYDQGVEGEVRLRLYVDAQGRVVEDSTRVSSSSGTPGPRSTTWRPGSGKPTLASPASSSPRART